MSQSPKQKSRLFWFLRTYYFRYHWQHCILTTLMALLLGVVSTLFAASLGPAIYGIVFAKQGEVLALSDLLGNNYAAIAHDWLGISVISATLLTLYLPFFYCCMCLAACYSDGWACLHVGTLWRAGRDAGTQSVGAVVLGT